MSLILEALKKSETRRRLGEAPDIGTPFTVKPRRRSPWPLIVILIAVAAGIGWWYLRTLPRPTEANTVVALPSPPAPPPIGRSPAGAQQAGSPAAKAGPAPAARESAATAQAQPKSDGPVPGPAAKPPLRTDGGAAGASAPGGAADLRAPRPVNQHLSLSAAQSPVSQSAPAAPAPTAQPPTSRVPMPPATAAAAPARPAAEPGAAPPAQPANTAKTESDAAAAKPADAAPSMPAAPAAPVVPQYYELAYAVRKDIPQFNLSMHVFAADPAARFIVVDGERKAEGDAVKEGLVLREVRTDGIVLEFRGQRFFYPRPGH